MLKIYGVFPSRTNRALWALEELEVPYQFYQLDFSQGESRSAYFLQLNSAGKVPVLQDGELIISESGAICNYLGDIHPESGLTPAPGTSQRAKYDQWMFFVQSELEQPLWTRAKHKFALPKEYRMPEINSTAVWEFQQALNIFAAGLGDSEFIVADRFTMADIMLTHTLGWAKVANLNIGHSNLIEYADRNLARPAVTRMFKKERLPLPKEKTLN